MDKIIDCDNVEKAKRMIKDSKEKPILLIAKNDAFNRKMIEYGKFDFIVDIENGKRKDNLRQIDSGLNHYLAKEAAKNKISLAIDMESVRGFNKRESGEVVEKIMQNIRLCRKAGTKIRLLNAKDKKDAFSWLISLGASTKQAKEAISF